VTEPSHKEQRIACLGMLYCGVAT